MGADKYRQTRGVLRLLECWRLASLALLVVAGCLAISGCSLSGSRDGTRVEWRSLPFRYQGAVGSTLYLRALSGGCGPQEASDIRVASIKESADGIDPRLTGRWKFWTGKNAACTADGRFICVRIALKNPVGNRAVSEHGSDSLAKKPRVVRPLDVKVPRRFQKQLEARLKYCSPPSG